MTRRELVGSVVACLASLAGRVTRRPAIGSADAVSPTPTTHEHLSKDDWNGEFLSTKARTFQLDRAKIEVARRSRDPFLAEIYRDGCTK